MKREQNPNSCPKCGAVLPPGESYRERFELCLAWDFEHPGSYGAVHHFIVGCYMLQHNEYSAEGWLEARKLIAQAIEEGTSPETLIKMNRQKFSNSRRKWKITGDEKSSAVDKIVWRRTIADIRLETAELYCADARSWATSVLADTVSIGPIL